MYALDWIIPALLLMYIIFQGRTTIPRVISFFFPGRRQLHFEDMPQTPIHQGHWDTIQPVIEKIKSLGFNQLGLMVENPVLWAKGSRELSLASQANRTFASVGFRGYKPSYFFYTPFTDGQIVITSYNAFRNFQKVDFVTTVVKADRPEETLEIHKQQVEDFIARGYVPFRDYNRENAMRANLMYYNASYPKRQLRVAGFTNLLFLVACTLVLVLFVIAAVR